MRIFEVDGTLRESLTYKDPTFPIEISTDNYRSLPAHTLDCHWHLELEFAVMESGELDYYISDRECIRLKEGDGIFINGNTMHMAKQAAGCGDAVMKVVAFAPSLLDHNVNGIIYQKYFQRIIGSSVQGVPLLHREAAAEKLLSLIDRIHGLDDTAFGYELECLELVSRLWRKFLAYISEADEAALEKKTYQKNDDCMKKMLFYIKEHLFDELTVDQIARSANVSRSECFKCFRRFSQKTPVEYINECRLSQAASLLTGTGRPVTEIASMCGFSTPSYFCKLFKERYHLSPAQYRKRVKK
ncbi:MAG: AraC family transcriptional regulator [Ruminococcus sp.]|jgi:AraC-like DNA-binding protein